MLYDLRTYTCRPGTIRKHLALYESSGWEIQREHLGQPVVYGQTETGNMNSYVHIWVYKDAADRSERRANLYADPRWQAYMKTSAEAGYLVEQNNTLLNPVSFFKPA